MSQNDTNNDELYHELTNDRTKAARAERTVGDADRVDDPRTVIRYVGEDRGVDQFQVAFTNTQGFPLGKTQRSIQAENHIRDWIDKNDAELFDARQEEMFAPTASEDSVGVALETDGGEPSDGAQRKERAKRIGDALRDGEVETAVEELAEDRQLVVYVDNGEDGWFFTGDESNIDAALSAVSKNFDSLDVEIQKHARSTHFGTGEMPA